ncbi:hypothetical protein BH09VER1_BH09VER1_53040 [soil metagenome]
MENSIAFASPEDNNPENSPWNQPRGNNNYEDLVLKPEYAERRLRFPVGQTWFRIVPKLAGSLYGWMLPLHVLQFERGRFVHPRTFKRSVRSAYDHAYAWAKENEPAALFSKANKTGVRLLTDPMCLFWVLVEQDRKYVTRLIQASGYDGSRGGAPGLGYKIWRLCQERDETGARVADVVSAAAGVLIKVEKNQPKGAKYPTYHLSLGQTPRPMDAVLEQMDPAERAVLCPLENVVRELNDEEEWQCLGKVIAPATVKQIRESLVPANQA